MDLHEVLTFAADRSKGSLITLRRDGRAQSSNVLYIVDGSVVSMSLTSDRAKTRNLQRDPRACLHVNDESFWQYVVLDGTVTLSPVAQSPDDATVDELVLYYRRLSGEHDDWADYRAAMVRERRLVARLQVSSAYGQVSE
jgi:PPOX class probable F420-dependent enzyme